MAAKATTILLLLCSLMVLMASSYKEEDLGRFGYMGDIEPSNWGSLNPHFYQCKNGTRQSPINIMTKDVVHDPDLHSLDSDYHVINGSLHDNGFNVELICPSTVGTLLVDGLNYTFQQMHWHFPSEHTINGLRFPVELHMVHSYKGERFAAVAILFKYGGPDPVVARLLPKLEELTKQVHSGNTDARIPVDFFNADSLGRHSKKYYRYIGSVTTPPCAEPVIWNVLTKVRDMSTAQAKRLRAPLPKQFHQNSRPLQPLNGRVVRLYRED